MKHVFPALATERLILRPLSPDDLEFVFQHFATPDVGRYLLDDAPVTTRAQAQAILDFYLSPSASFHNRWVIVRRDDGRPIGTCGFHKWIQPYHKVEIGYDLSPSAWKQGYMTEALHRILTYAFTEMAINRVEAVVYPQNSASIRLAERLGFVREGLMREVICRDGQFYDHWLMALLRRDWAGADEEMERE